MHSGFRCAFRMKKVICAPTLADSTPLKCGHPFPSSVYS
ncbi:hypothetical protein C4K26_2394 [Pseudomonas chlororaphis]|nr:hypothetical protein C4K26_2394 [Pseudomonas chlororaphis]